ncbi:MAG: deoxyribose-phosphate aldolase [Spirochaetia bacterium]
MQIEEKVKTAEKKVADVISRSGHHLGGYKGYTRPGRDEALNRYIDHTLLKPEARAEDFEKTYREAAEWHTYSVCVPPNRTVEALKALSGTDVKVCTVIGFPLGYQLPEVKAREAAVLAEKGCHEFDMVLPVGLLKDRNIPGVFRDIQAVAEAVPGRILKVILETGLLSEEEKIIGGITALYAGAAILKTSTGFAGSGATEEDIRLLRVIAGGRAGVKAAGGIKDADFAKALIKAGADRIGASSTGVILGKDEPKGNVSAY